MSGKHGHFSRKTGLHPGLPRVNRQALKFENITSAGQDMAHDSMNGLWLKNPIHPSNHELFSVTLLKETNMHPKSDRLM